MTFEVILHLIKSCVFILLIIVFIDFFYQNPFINECARKKKANILEPRRLGIMESRARSHRVTEFFSKYREELTSLKKIK